MPSDFVKQEDSTFAVQLKTFSDGVNSTSAPNGATVGLSPAQCLEAKNDAAYVLHVNQQQDKAKGFSQAFTKFKNDLRNGSATPIIEPVFDVPAAPPTAVLAGVEGRFRQKATSVKNSLNYTTAIGEAWGIVAPAGSSDLGLPGFTINFDAGHPIINWTKGRADSVDIYKDSGAGWVYMGRDLKSPWKDISPLPAAGSTAIWKYKIIFVKNDEQTGDFSEVREATVKGNI
jgi:hypothetical protein